MVRKGKIAPVSLVTHPTFLTEHLFLRCFLESISTSFSWREASEEARGSVPHFSHLLEDKNIIIKP